MTEAARSLTRTRLLGRQESVGVELGLGSELRLPMMMNVGHRVRKGLRVGLRVLLMMNKWLTSTCA